MSAIPTVEPPLTRDRIATFVLIALAVVGAVICIVIVAPFVPAIAWALAVAVVAHPVHDRVNRYVQNNTLAAGIAVAIITAGILIPVAFVAQEIGREATQGYDRIQRQLRSGEIVRSLERNPSTRQIGRWVRRNVDINEELDKVGEGLKGQVGVWVTQTMWTVFQLAITVFLLFYFFRDRKKAVQAVKGLLPLSHRESDYMLERVRSVIHATVYGTLSVAAVQGMLGGLMFWFLGLPSPLFWGFVMGLMATVPMLGTFVVWAPTAVMLIANGEWQKGLILAGWGALVVSTIDNVLYPMLVGEKVRLHTVPVFIAILGGLFAFGASGLVLGPVALAVTLALIDILRRRTIGSRSAQEPT